MGRIGAASTLRLGDESSAPCRCRAGGHRTTRYRTARQSLSHPSLRSRRCLGPTTRSRYSRRRRSRFSVGSTTGTCGWCRTRCRSSCVRQRRTGTPTATWCRGSCRGNSDRSPSTLARWTPSSVTPRAPRRRGDRRRRVVAAREAVVTSPDLCAAVEDDVPAHDRRPNVDVGDVLGVDGPR